MIIKTVRDGFVAAPDVCAEVICFNGGFCKDGVCQCQKGFERPFCDAGEFIKDQNAGIDAGEGLDTGERLDAAEG